MQYEVRACNSSPLGSAVATEQSCAEQPAYPLSSPPRQGAGSTPKDPRPESTVPDQVPDSLRLPDQGHSSGSVSCCASSSAHRLTAPRVAL
eukprot:10118703-Alexandrium_andersonii.AAC.1